MPDELRDLKRLEKILIFTEILLKKNSSNAWKR